jgi:hypothetical protein
MPHTSQTVLLLDAFEEANEDTQSWIYQELLIDLYKLPNVLTVIAGRELPEPEITWHDIAITTELKSVTVKDYQTYRNSIGATELEEDKIEFLHKVFKGRPGDFAEAAKSFIPKGGAA